jgi:hypothetical protein
LLIPSVTAIAYDVWVFLFVPSFLQSRDIMFLYRLQDFKADALLSTVADALQSPQGDVTLVAGLNRKGQRCMNSTLMPSRYIDKLQNGILTYLFFSALSLISKKQPLEELSRELEAL